MLNSFRHTDHTLQPGGLRYAGLGRGAGSGYFLIFCAMLLLVQATLLGIQFSCKTLNIPPTRKYKTAVQSPSQKVKVSIIIFARRALSGVIGWQWG